MVRGDLIKQALYVKVLREVREETLHPAVSITPGGWNAQGTGLCQSLFEMRKETRVSAVE